MHSSGQWLSIIPTYPVEDNPLNPGFTHESPFMLPWCLLALTLEGSGIPELKSEPQATHPVQPQPPALKNVCVLPGSLPRGGGQRMSGDFLLLKRSPSCCVRGLLHAR